LVSSDTRLAKTSIEIAMKSVGAVALAPIQLIVAARAMLGMARKAPAPDMTPSAPRRLK
jgi:hypothetical protein